MVCYWEILLIINHQTQKPAAEVNTSSPMEVAEAINQDDATRNAKKYPPASRGAGRGRGNFQRGRGKFHGGRGQPRGRPGVSERLCQNSKRINAVTAGVKVIYTLTINLIFVHQFHFVKPLPADATPKMRFIYESQLEAAKWRAASEYDDFMTRKFEAGLKVNCN